jgi:hypothetical protein
MKLADIPPGSEIAYRCAAKMIAAASAPAFNQAAARLLGRLSLAPRL